MSQDTFKVTESSFSGWSFRFRTESTDESGEEKGVGMKLQLIFSWRWIHSSKQQNPCVPDYNSIPLHRDFPSGSDGKASAYNAGDPSSVPGSGRSPREGNSNPVQYPCLENPMDSGAWWATVHGVVKSWTRLGDLTFTFIPLHRFYSWWNDLQASSS